MDKTELDEILRLHGMWLRGESSGKRADLTCAVLRNADLSNADLKNADLKNADLTGADLKNAYLTGAHLAGADLTGAVLTGADLTGADLTDAKGLVKPIGVEPGNTYWKRFRYGFCNEGYYYRVGRNDLRNGETFADDDRELCGYPGFHFASRSWCAVNYNVRPLEARIRIPEDAQICEPWATDGKASASAIEILQVFDVATGADVTEQFRGVADGRGNAVVKTKFTPRTATFGSCCVLGTA